MTSIDAYNVISAGDEEKSSRVVERQSLQITAAGIPCGDHFVRVHVDCHRLSRLLNICVKNPALIIDRVPFRQILQWNFRFRFQVLRRGSIENLDRFGCQRHRLLWAEA